VLKTLVRSPIANPHYRNGLEFDKTGLKENALTGIFVVVSIPDACQARHTGIRDAFQRFAA
jgi:hypothetical protein